MKDRRRMLIRTLEQDISDNRNVSEYTAGLIDKLIKELSDEEA